MIDMLVELAGSALLFLGLTLATIGLYALLRKPDIFHQLHAAGLVTNAALLLVLLASFATGSAEIVTSAVLVAGFVLVTAPLSGHAVARAAWRRDHRPPDEATDGEPDPDR
ncbi:MAG: monovalent cation/H(+) antiporter subunit G [Chloroflexi bacterium]|nr:monovalent cation/H(+) antiporter subunit G [Chloroflexota bacterium]